MNIQAKPNYQDHLLKEISESFLILNRSKSITKDIPVILEKIGSATGVDRVYIFKNINEDSLSYIFEWNNEGTPSQIEFEPLKKLPWSVFPELKEVLEKNLPINDFVSNSKNDWFRELMDEQHIVSYLFVPIFVKNKFWGFIGFDNCSRYELFSEGQLSALRSLAEVLGNVLYSSRVEKQKAKAEKNEKQTLKLFNLLSKNVDDILFLLDKDFKITYYSPSYEKLTKERLKYGESFLELFNLKEENFSSLNLINNYKIITEKFFEKINRKVSIEHIVKPIGKEISLKNKFLISSRDVTDREKLLHKITTNLNKERELNRLKSKFISMTSHELRTPLSTILSSVDLLEIISDSMVDQSHKEDLIKHIRKIQIQINRLNRIISEVFVLEKSSSEKLEKRLEWIDLNAIVKQILFNYFKEAYEQFELKLHPEPILIQSDKEWIINILRNVIENAIKYGKTEIQKANITTAKFENKILFEVEDFGLGIPKNDQPFIFESFYRSSNVLNQKGTGLGLAIVKELVDKINGQILFQSKEGYGTKFVIEIPNEKNHTIG
ncbi:GAF domain-containing sensor histidine kinase [uncultured Algoriphagus sp.]|uniref:GAF domain-containing sensor histidine kinase n=1 Tax=uncultured Algoriphagus sp. TaxID=417365 RepID=UPI00259397DF|nr:GAF domain-containing sensor histidine kinase [uncultured Algoriphagus sp.]